MVRRERLENLPELQMKMIAIQLIHMQNNLAGKHYLDCIAVVRDLALREIHLGQITKGAQYILYISLIIESIVSSSGNIVHVNKINNLKICQSYFFFQDTPVDDIIGFLKDAHI